MIQAYFRKAAAGAAFMLLSMAAAAQDLGNIKDEKWATIHGSVGAIAYIYGMDGAPARRVPFSYILTGNATLTLKGLALPFSFQYSEQQRDFRQPFNQFGVSPTYKWLRFHLGYRSVSFSRYTLDGHQFLGVGVEANPGILRFGAVYGRFLKAVQEDTTKQVYNAPSQYPIATYNRYGYGVKLGIGKEKNFFDLVYFKGKDDSSSVAHQPEIQLTAPAENVSLGFRTHLTMLKKLTFDADAGASIYTRDQRADTIQLEEIGWQKAVKGVLLPRLSTNLYYAGDASLAWKDKQYALALKYARILPDYRSMGIYYIQTDLERYTFAPSFNTKKGTFQSSASIGFEHDNIEQKKEAQTQRLIGSLNASLNPSPNWGITASYSNFGITQKPGLKSLNDTVTLDQVTQSVILTPRYTLQRPGAIHNFVYLFSDQTLNDRNRYNAQNYNMTNINNTLSYVVVMKKSGVGIDASAYHVRTVVSAGTNTSAGGSLGANQSFFKGLLNSTVSANYSANVFNGASDGNTLQLSTTQQISYKRHHRFSLNYLFTRNESKSEAINRSFRESLLTLQYAYSF